MPTRMSRGLASAVLGMPRSGAMPGRTAIPPVRSAREAHDSALLGGILEGRGQAALEEIRGAGILRDALNGSTALNNAARAMDYTRAFGSPGQVVELLGAAAAMMNPWMAAYQQGMMLREVLAWLYGAPDVEGRNALSARRRNVVGAGWVQYAACGGGEYFPAKVTALSATSCSGFLDSTFNKPPPFVGTIYQAPASYPTLIRYGSWATSYDARPAGLPGYYSVGVRDSWRWEAPTISGPAVAGHLPYQTWVGTGLNMSPMGLGAPLTAFRRRAAMLGLLGVPGAPLPVTQPTARDVEISNMVKMLMGVRESEEPARPPKVRPPPLPPPWARPEYGQAFEPVSGVYDGGQWRKAPPHVYRRYPGRMKKLKVSGVAWRAFSMIMGAFTETNDFVNAIWKSMPRSQRHAGLTSTGNRRTDSMLKDIVNGWDTIDWDQAIANVVANEVEDAIIGRTARTLNAASVSSGPGFGTMTHDAWGTPLSEGVVKPITGWIESRGPGIIRAVRTGEW